MKRNESILDVGYMIISWLIAGSDMLFIFETNFGVLNWFGAFRYFNIQKGYEHNNIVMAWGLTLDTKLN